MPVVKHTGYFESFDGAKIYYETRGEGPPVVLAYGLVCSVNHWNHQVRHFSDKYQVIYMDYRGHHMTPMPETRENLSLDAIAQDFQFLLQHLKIKNASFWGHSFGVPILLRAFEFNPEIFNSFVMINGFATDPLKGRLSAEVGVAAVNAARRAYSQLPETMNFLWKLAVTNPLSLQMTALAGGFNLDLTSWKDIEIYAKGAASLELDVFLRLFEQMKKYDGTTVLSRIEIPTLVIGGTKDTVTPISWQETLHKKIKHSELLIVPYGSHCTQLDMPDFVNLKIERFLSESVYK